MLVVHVSDQQIQCLLNILVKAGSWKWAQFIWEKGETDAVQGPRIRYCNEAWFVCWRKDKPPEIDIKLAAIEDSSR